MKYRVKMKLFLGCICFVFLLEGCGSEEAFDREVSIEKIGDEIDKKTDDHTQSQRTGVMGLASDFPSLGNYEVTGGRERYGIIRSADEPFWVSAKQGDGSKWFIKTNLDGEVLAKNMIGFPYEDTGLVVPGDGHIYTENGEDCTDCYCYDDDGRIVDIIHDSTGVSIWTAFDVDSFDSHDSIYQIKDLSGNTKETFSSILLNEENNTNWRGDGNLRYLDDAWYELVWKPGEALIEFDEVFLLNVETGENWHLSNPVYEYKDGFFAKHDTWETYLVNINTWDIITPSLLQNTEWKYIGEGLAYYCTNPEKNKVFVDINSDTFLFQTDPSYDIGEYKDGYAPVNIINPDGIGFASVIDHNGEFGFAPVKGSIERIGDASDFNGFSYLLTDENREHCLVNQYGDKSESFSENLENIMFVFNEETRALSILLYDSFSEQDLFWTKAIQDGNKG